MNSKMLICKILDDVVEQVHPIVAQFYETVLNKTLWAHLDIAEWLFQKEVCIKLECNWLWSRLLNKINRR